MDSINLILVMVISMFGIPLGIWLALIAPEELVPGKKYFFLIKNILYWIIIFIIIYEIYLIHNYWLLTHLVLIIIMFIVKNNLNLLIKKIQFLYYSETINYLIFISFYFLILQVNLKLLLASIIFIYSLIIGTLIKSGDIKIKPRNKSETEN